MTTRWKLLSWWKIASSLKTVVIFNEFYINIVEQATDKKPPAPLHKHVSSAEEEIETYKDYPCKGRSQKKGFR